jgi:uncharacterized membrane protein YraQ (UPF0718 family)
MKPIVLALAALWALAALPAQASEPAATQRGAFALAHGRAQVTSQLRERRTGGAAQLDFEQFQAGSGRLITRYDVEQTKLMHLVVVRDDFQGFMHVHPSLKDGRFSIALPLSAAHAYYAFADTTPAGLSKQVFRFTIGKHSAPPPSFQASNVSPAGGYETRLSAVSLEAGRPAKIEATITRSGKVVSGLRPYLGAAAHAVLVNIKSLDYVHVHPMAMSAGDAMDDMELPPSATFDGRMNLMLPALQPGTYRLWLQFQAPAGLVAAPFTLIVAQQSFAAAAFKGTGRALLLAAGMFWQVGWSLILGFLLSGLVQALVSKDGMRAKLGRNGFREIALATFYGAVSSSCSYAAAAMSKTLFKKGAGLIPSLAFLFSSTNLVMELGLILLLLMGWQFAAAEWIGGVVLVAIMAVLVKLTYPAKLVEQAREHVDEATGHEHGDNAVSGASLLEKLRNPQTRVLAAQNAAMDWSMLWKDLLAGFLIAGALAAFVPDETWKGLFLTAAPSWLQVPLNAVAGTLIAILTFVCSIGNVPMAAVLWGSGISFAGVLSFLYADLIVLPLLDIYRKYYGWKMAAYIGAIFFVTMTATGIIMDHAFGLFHAIPVRTMTTMTDPASLFQINYTFFLNLIFGGLAVYVWHLNASSGVKHHCHA